MVDQKHLISQALALEPARPLRAWSLAVSFLGDCIVPRGGSVGLTTIAEVLGAAGIDHGVVRTAMSRLASNLWVKREKSGRNSYYSLTGEALSASLAASATIYAPAPRNEPCGWLILPQNQGLDGDPRKRRAALLARGAGLLDGQVPIFPAGTVDFSENGLQILETAPLSDEMARNLVKSSFDLAPLREAYDAFISGHGKLLQQIEKSGEMSGVEAVVLRVLTIHRFRRIVLRDPGIPLRYLPPDWPGSRARALARGLWLALRDPAERWLDENAGTNSGPLPGFGAEDRRFR